jgi:hypothetical protein
VAERQKSIGRRWLWALAGVGGVQLVVFALVVGPWLFTRYPRHGLTAEQELKAKNDVRTTLVQALGGLAVAGGLVITYRTFRHNRIEQEQRRVEQDRLFELTRAEQAERRAEQDRTYRLNVAAQVNDTYTRAVEQLGHEEAPVRLGAMYSLERLAQENVDLRQTVVNVLCAYLRMPYVLPGSEIPAGSDLSPGYELQVRQTAQRLLADHLRCPEGLLQAARDASRRGVDPVPWDPGGEPSDQMVQIGQGLLHPGVAAQHLEPTVNETFWPGISLDLTGAALVDFAPRDASVVRAIFAEAIFVGPAFFVWAAFTDGANFFEANFTTFASFIDGRLHNADFRGATFGGEAWFDRATFTGAGRLGAAFNHDTRFELASFDVKPDFRLATFSGSTEFGGARVLNLVHDPNVVGDDPRLLWPGGWTLRPDPKNPTEGTLVRTDDGGDAPARST